MYYHLSKSRFTIENQKIPLAFFTFFILGFFGYTLHAVDYFSAVPGNIGDARFNSVILEHIFRWVMGHDKSLWSPPFFYPFEGALAFSENHLGSSIPYILLRLIGFGREVAFDGWFLIGNSLNFLAAYIAMRRLGLTRIGSAAGAFAFTFALPGLIQEGHAQLVYRFGTPLAYAAFWKLITEKQFRYLWQVALWSTIQFYCSIYLGIFLTYLLVATLASIVILDKRRKFFSDFIKYIHDERKDMIVFTSAIVLSCTLAVLWLLYNYYTVSLDYGFKRSLDEIKLMLPRLSSYLLADRALLSSWIGNLVGEIPMRHEHQMFFGFGIWALGIFGAVSAWRGHIQQDLGKSAILSVAMIFIITLNVGGYSLYFLLAYIPGINSIRAVSRIVLVMMLPVGILVAIGTEQIYKHAGQASYLRKAAVLTAILAILGTEVVAYPPDKAPIDAWISRVNELRSKLPEQLLANPIVFVTKKGLEPYYLSELDGMILAQDLDVPTLNGYSGNIPPGYLEPLPCYSYINRLNAYVSYRKLKISDMKAVANRVVTISLTPCEYEPVIAFEGAISVDQAKSIILNISDVKMTNEKIEAKIVAYNGSSTSFNTISMAGKPIRLSWRFVQLSPSGQHLSEPGWDARQDLIWTIAPNNSKQAIIFTDPPKIPGSFLFEVSLVQEGVAWLHQLGMNTASYPLKIK